MLKKTVYFRTQEDLDKFNAIKNKAEWLHEHLNGNYAHLRKGLFNIGAKVDSFAGLKEIVDDSTETVELGKLYRTNFDGTHKEDMTDEFFEEPTLEPMED